MLSILVEKCLRLRVRTTWPFSANIAVFFILLPTTVLIMSPSLHHCHYKCSPSLIITAITPLPLPHVSFYQPLPLFWLQVPNNHYHNSDYHPNHHHYCHKSTPTLPPPQPTSAINTPTAATASGTSPQCCIRSAVVIFLHSVLFKTAILRRPDQCQPPSTLCILPARQCMLR